MSERRAAVILECVILIVTSLAIALRVDWSEAFQGFNAPDAWWCEQTAIWGAALSVPSVVVAYATRAPRKPLFFAGSLVPMACQLALAMYFGSQANTLLAVSVGHVISAPQNVGGHAIPAGSRLGRSGNGDYFVTLPSGARYDGVPFADTLRLDAFGSIVGSELQLSQDVTIRGVRCSASKTVRYQHEQIDGCTLAVDARIDGVPCASGHWADLTAPVTCTLSGSWRYRSVVWPAGTTVNLARPEITTGPVSPRGVRFLGGRVPAGTDFQYDTDRVLIAVASSDDTSNTWYCQSTTQKSACTGSEKTLAIADLNLDGHRFAAGRP